jgi:hypothetical protein
MLRSSSARDIMNGYMLGLREDNNAVALFRRDKGQWTCLATRPFSHLPQTWYSMVVRAVGPRIECFVDGQRYLQAFDETYKTGAIGLGGWDNDVLFDDVAVEAVDP